MRSRDIYSLIFILLVAGIALSIVFAPEGRWLFNRDVSVRLGLDLRGGIQVLLRAAEPVERSVMQTAAGVIERRINALGVAESVVQLSGNDRIIVEIPGIDNPEQAIETLRGTGKLEFIDTKGEFLAPGTIVRTTGSPNPIALRPTATVTGTEEITSTVSEGPIYESITDGKDLDLSSVQPPQIASQSLTNQFAVPFAFTGESARRLEQFTAANIQRPMCIVLDNQVFSCPVIQAALIGGRGEITTNTRQDAEQIYTQLKYGALPVPLQVESSRTVSASLGQGSVDASIVAGLVGLLTVALFMILFYRLPGFLATVALLLYTVISFALYQLIPVTLTLPGIAGFILSIGVAVDANVLIFARLKEELRRGRSLNASIDAAFVEAWPAIRDSSVATLITCTILFMFGNTFGVSLIKGFALTLGLGILLSLFTAMVVTRTFLHVINPLPFAQNPWLYELKDAPGMRHARETA
ncbi:MAG: protein translocase subunit SecD [Roseiflexus sp.]|nr:protein translocase subunit SecD [Roseiflexus sp.]MBO9363897.1 protein translocase subunit SecD [Roseiflexus sp.]MBO9382169.1 protein translocase subunit SecD [Roseiflexus sp.]